MVADIIEDVHYNITIDTVTVITKYNAHEQITCNV